MTSPATFCVITLMMLCRVESICNPNSGPSGGLQCIRIPRYQNIGQWATCLTDSYIVSKSKGHHGCENRPVVRYCYYQCMLEVHNKDDGEVLPDCSCGSQGITIAPFPDFQLYKSTTAAPLPSWCNSPSGSECQWYQDCLLVKFPCDQTGHDDNSILYAHMFCQMRQRQQNSLSEVAQRWIEAVGICLQVELVPLLRPFQTATCTGIKDRAIHSQAGCYLTPYDNSSSICDLTLSDFWTVFWTVKAEIASAFVESSLGLMKVAQACQTGTAKAMADYMKKIQITVSLPRALQFQSTIRKKRSADINAGFQFAKLSKGAITLSKGQIPDSSFRVKRQSSDSWQGESSEQLYYHQTAREVVDQLANHLRWNKETVLWFSYGQFEDSYDDLRVHIFLADASLRPSDLNLTQVVVEAAQAYQKGEVFFRSHGSNLPGGLLEGCDDQECQRLFLNVTGTSGAAVTLETSLLTVILAAALLAMFCG